MSKQVKQKRKLSNDNEITTALFYHETMKEDIIFIYQNIAFEFITNNERLPVINSTFSPLQYSQKAFDLGKSLTIGKDIKVRDIFKEEPFRKQSSFILAELLGTLTDDELDNLKDNFFELCKYDRLKNRGRKVYIINQILIQSFIQGVMDPGNILEVNEWKCTLEIENLDIILLITLILIETIYKAFFKVQYDESINGFGLFAKTDIKCGSNNEISYTESMVLETELLNTRITVIGESVFNLYGLYPLSYYLNSNQIKPNTEVKFDVIESGVIIYNEEEKELTVIKREIYVSKICIKKNTIIKKGEQCYWMYEFDGSENLTNSSVTCSTESSLHQDEEKIYDYACAHEIFINDMNYRNAEGFQSITIYLDELGFFTDSPPIHLQYLSEKNIRHIASFLKSIQCTLFLNIFYLDR